MLRFFRRIRQRLLTENRFSKHLLYAVGEILLVVIGILIAFQVDSWNEERIQRKRSDQVLLNLKEETKELNTWKTNYIFNVLPYSLQQGVIIDLMVSNGMIKSENYLNADVCDSERFQNVIASSILMTPELLKGAKGIMEDYGALLRIIEEKAD